MCMHKYLEIVIPSCAVFYLPIPLFLSTTCLAGLKVNDTSAVYDNLASCYIRVLYGNSLRAADVTLNSWCKFCKAEAEYAAETSLHIIQTCVL
jgi:hypothetical protein